MTGTQVSGLVCFHLEISLLYLALPTFDCCMLYIFGQRPLLDYIIRQRLLLTYIFGWRPLLPYPFSLRPLLGYTYGLRPLSFYISLVGLYPRLSYVWTTQVRGRGSMCSRSRLMLYWEQRQLGYRISSGFSGSHGYHIFIFAATLCIGVPFGLVRAQLAYRLSW